ncbi:hypothetical protein PanWU01x14_307500, partial [Parasponia andersonii]
LLLTRQESGIFLKSNSCKVVDIIMHVKYNGGMQRIKMGKISISASKETKAAILKCFCGEMLEQHSLVSILGTSSCWSSRKKIYMVLALLALPKNNNHLLLMILIN